MRTIHSFVFAIGAAWCALSAVSVELPPHCAPYERPAPEYRGFRSAAVDAKIEATARRIADPTLRRMFVACYPNTLDTTVRGKGYVITGDIDAMWLRDSAAQVWPYLRFLKEDPALASFVREVILRQFTAIRLDPYANAFYASEGRKSGWFTDRTAMKPGLHERKYEIDSLCYPLRLAYGYWKSTGDATSFDGKWVETVRVILKTFREQQRKGGQKTSYTFRRMTESPTDSLGNGGYGAPVRPVGLIASAFRPSDDACTMPFLVPSNFFAADVLRKSAEILENVNRDKALAGECRALADEVSKALQKYAKVKTDRWGEVYAFEVDGFGGQLLMDDANAPSLLSLPYLCGVDHDDPTYVNTRRMILSPDGNPYFFKGKFAEGIGSPHTGLGRIWPMSIIMRILTSTDDAEKLTGLKMLEDTTAGTGFMHESVNPDNPEEFSRSWFAWANTLFGEVVCEMAQSGLLENQGNERPASPDARVAFDDYMKAYWNPAKRQFRLHKTGDKLQDFWFAAHGFDMLLDAARVFGDGEAKSTAVAFYDGFMERYPDWKKNSFNDDILWWTISCTRASRRLGDRRYLAQARTMFDWLCEREIDDTLGGGMWWKNSEHKSKNACNNFPAVITACGLYGATHDEKYRRTAIRLYDWGRKNLFDAKTGAVDDNVNLEGKVTHWHFTYNSGTFIGAALRLWRMTNNRGYLNDAILAARYMTHDLSKNGVLKATGQGDGGAFNGIGMRYLSELAAQKDGMEFRAFVLANAESVWKHRRASDGLSGPDWRKTPSDDFDIEGQTANSGLVTLILAAGLR